MRTVLFGIFGVLCFLQLGAPFLAQRIKERFGELGVAMNSRPAFAIFNISNFWSEAARLQKSAQDPMVRQLLSIYYAWWAAAIVVFLLIIFVAFPSA
jgi:hypothetical protein